MRSDIAERAALDALDTEGMVTAVRELVRIPSWGGRESEAQRFVATLMGQLGLEVDLWEIDLDEVTSHPDCSWEIERDEALGVVGSVRGTGAGPSLLLNGHVDVVPPGDETLWEHPPFGAAVVEGRLVGRGALDMKGPLLAGLFAIAAVRAAEIPLRGAVHLQSVIGEEDGGLGTLAGILRGWRADAAIVMEPTDFEVATIQAGCLNFRVHVPGVAAHGAVRDEGVNAFEKLFGIYGAVQELDVDRNDRFGDDERFSAYRSPFPISCGKIEGGDWASSVPDHAFFEGRMGIAPDESFDDARAELEGAVSHAARLDSFLKDHPPVVEWWGGRFLPARMPPGHPLAEQVVSATSDELGRRVREVGVPFGADAGLLDRVGGVPTLLFGAGDIRLSHKPNESIGLEELEQMARVLVRTIVRYCGVDPA